MDFEWSEEDKEFRQELVAVITEQVPNAFTDLVPGEEPASEFTYEFCRALGRRGFLAPHWPTAYGGRGASHWQFIILGEELWRAGEPRGAQYMNVNWIGPAIIASGSEEQKLEHLDQITAGNVVWCQGFSEMGAGTDLGALGTTAVRDGDTYVISGTKVWSSYAKFAKYCFLVARTDLESERSDGLSIFIVPTDTPGMTVRHIPSILDIHEFYQLEFRDVVVPASAMLGAEHAGWSTILDLLSHERIGGPRYARCLAILHRLAERAEKESWEANDGFRVRIAQAIAACEAARVLVYRVIDDRAKGRREGVAANLARVAVVRAERLTADLTLDIAPRDSIERGSLGNSQFKSALIAGLGGGSVEVQLNAIAKSYLGSERSYK